MGKYHSDTQEKVEAITYSPGVQDSGDLEAATRAITATSKQAAPDYTASLTTPAPSDSRLTAVRLGVRVQVTIDSFGGAPAATRLFYSLERTGAGEIASGEWTATGAQYAALTLTTFSIGAANEYKLFLWVDQGNAVVSLCQLWQTVGTTATSEQNVLALKHCGLLWLGAFVGLVGTGNPTAYVVVGDSYPGYAYMISGTGVTSLDKPHLILCNDVVNLKIKGSVTTDINYYAGVTAILRSQP